MPNPYESMFEGEYPDQPVVPPGFVELDIKFPCDECARMATGYYNAEKSLLKVVCLDGHSRTVSGAKF